MFKDHFSARAPLYSRFRPSYPDELFSWIATFVEKNTRAWDCATGNGQAAKGLARYFDQVIATDASESQIERAEPRPRIEYRVASAEASGLADSSVDLVTVAQAAHWFDLESFFIEAKRVLTRDGAVVLWGYGDPILDSKPLDRIVHDYNRGTIESYWMPERRLLLDRYRTIQFPFRELSAPQLTMECEWTLDELAGYLRTWSATAAYATEIGRDPIADVDASLSEYWGKREERHLIRWPLFIRAGYVG